MIVCVRKIAQQIIFAIFIVNDLYCIGIVVVLQLAFKTHGLTDFEVIPNKVCIVILAACKVAVHEIKVVCIHFVTFLGLNIISRCKNRSTLFHIAVQVQGFFRFFLHMRIEIPT